MMRWTSLVLGAAAFLAAHVVETARWTSWFSTQWEPFFLNAGPAVAFTAACALLAGLLAAWSASDRRDALIHAGNVTAGAAVAMIGTLFWTGPGTLFPIAIVLGIIVLAVGSYLGALVTLPFKTAGRGGGDVHHRTGG